MTAFLFGIFIGAAIGFAIADYLNDDDDHFDDDWEHGFWKGY